MREGAHDHWIPPLERERVDERRRRRFFEEWIGDDYLRRNVQFGLYAELRDEGTWNDYARETWPHKPGLLIRDDDDDNLEEE